jgi:hypothetical protein
MQGILMKYTSFIFVLLLALQSAAEAQAPTSDALFDRSAALLNTPAASSIGTIEAHAGVTVGDRTYDTIVKASISGDTLGDAMFQIIEAEGTRTYRDTGGKLTGQRGNGELQELPATMTPFIHGHQFHRRILFPKLELASYDTTASEGVFDGKAAYRVNGKTPDGSALSYYFDRTSGFILGFELTVEEETGPRPMTFTIRDWRERAGQSLFWKLEILDKADLYIYNFARILLLP